MPPLAALSFRGRLPAPVYAVLAPALILSQHAMVAFAYFTAGERLVADLDFWLLPLRRLAELPGLSPAAAAAAFAFALAATALLAMLSFRRASGSFAGHAVAAFTIVPMAQIPATVIVGLLPMRADAQGEAAREVDSQAAHIVQGVIAGVAILIVAVFLSAVAFGAYGWGLFVLTPFLVGLASAYISNRDVPLERGRTVAVVLSAAALGSFALIMLALEGFVCVLMAAPLGIGVALLGGALGRAAAAAGHRRGRPLLSLAVVPALFALESAIPPVVEMTVEDSIAVAAPPEAVWQALVSEAPIRPPPGLVGYAGLSYPVRAEILGSGGAGAERRGYFSTGLARERITEWVPARRLAFAVIEQPPAMEEMSPYRRVHAPHVSGYFDTVETRFELTPLAGGETRLTITASHVLRLDPVLYWEPLARWAVRSNMSRVLRDIEAKAQAAAED